MSTIRSHGLLTPTCDSCGDVLPAEADFYEMVRAKKAAGWRTVKEDGEYVDTCLECLKVEKEGV